MLKILDSIYYLFYPKFFLYFFKEYNLVFFYIELGQTSV